MTKKCSHNLSFSGRRILSFLMVRDYMWDTRTVRACGRSKAVGLLAVATFLLLNCFATPAFADAPDPKLLESLSKVDAVASYTAEVNKTALYNIESQGPIAVESLLAILKDPASKYRAQAAFVLGKLAPSDEVVRALTAALSATEPHVVAAAATALGEIGAPTATSAVSELINTAQRESRKVRVTAIVVTSKGSVPQQAEVIQGNAEVKAAVAKTLGKLGPAAKAGYRTLLLLLDDPDAGVRESAARSLTKVGGDSSELLTALTLLLHDSNFNVRGAALEGLRELKGDPSVIIPKLIDLFDREEQLLTNDDDLFFGVGIAISKYGPDSIPPLMVALSDKNKYVQAGAAFTLGLVGSPAIPAVPKLIELTKSDFPVNHWAMFSLGRLGPLTDEAPLDVLVSNLGSNDESRQKSAIVSIITYTDVLQTVESDASDVHRLYKTIDALKRAKARIKDNHDLEQTGVTEEKIDSYISIVRRIKDQQSGVLGKQFVDFAKEHKIALAPVAWVLFWSLFWSVVFFVRPASIVEINNRMSRVTDFSLMAMPLHHFFLVSLFRYHPHVLDAWVRSKLPRIRPCFEAKDTVAERDMYLPAPVVLNGKALATLSAPDLRACQHLSNRMLFLIWGEGGLGKTTLACQIARWGMSEEPGTSLLGRPVIPIFIEHDLLIDSKQDMVLQTVRGQIGLLTGEIPPPDDLVRQLLRQKRAMVIFDHFSEMLQSTRRFIRPGSATFFVNLMVITSRIDEQLDAAPKNTIRPMRIQGDRLSSFMEAYLTARGKRELFDDSEYFEHCKRLSVLVGKGNTTVLLAKLYADQMIASKEGQIQLRLRSSSRTTFPTSCSAI
jgi:FOG: HEAT repeat